MSDKTLKWSAPDSEEAFKRNMYGPETRERLQSLGWTEDSITYRFNSHAFRCEEFDDRPAGIAVGCSFTAGTGVNIDQAWPTILGQMLGIHIWNLGVAGGTQTTCYRILEHYINAFDPKFVVYLEPPGPRLEFFDGTQWMIHHFSSETKDEYIKKYLTYTENYELYCRMTLRSIHDLCAERSIPFYTEHPYAIEGISHDKDARDLQHFGPAGHHLVAEVFHEKIQSRPYV